MELGEAQIEPGKPRYPLNDASAPCAWMKRSAASSSSAVVTPGWHLDRSMRRQRAWIAPDAAICSIWSGVFLMIMLAGPPVPRLALQFLLHAAGGQHRPDPVVDLVGVARTVHVAQDPALLVVRHQ